MVDRAAPAASSPQPGRFRKLLSRQGLIGGAGIVSVIVGAVIGLIWIGTHSAYWEGQADCSAYIDGSPLLRYSIVIAALLAGITITVTLIRIATRPAPQTKAIVGYWISTVILWTMLAATIAVAFGVSVNSCLRILSP